MHTYSAMNSSSTKLDFLLNFLFMNNQTQKQSSLYFKLPTLKSFLDWSPSPAHSLKSIWNPVIQKIGPFRDQEWNKKKLYHNFIIYEAAYFSTFILTKIDI